MINCFPFSFPTRLLSHVNVAFVSLYLVSFLCRILTPGRKRRGKEMHGQTEPRDGFEEEAAGLGEEKKKKESGAGRRVRLVEMGWGVWLLKGKARGSG